jgi:hypothetical protein
MTHIEGVYDNPVYLTVWVELNDDPTKTYKLSEVPSENPERITFRLDGDRWDASVTEARKLALRFLAAEELAQPVKNIRTVRITRMMPECAEGSEETTHYEAEIVDEINPYRMSADQLMQQGIINHIWVAVGEVDRRTWVERGARRR